MADDQIASAGATENVTENGAGSGAEKSADPAAGEARTFSQADLERIVSERLERAARQAERATEKARRDAEESSLAEQKKFQELADKRQERVIAMERRVEELQAGQARLERYEKALTVYRDAAFADLPDHIKELLRDRDVAEQLQWLSKHRDVVSPAAPNRPFFPPVAAHAASANGTEEERRMRSFRPRL